MNHRASKAILFILNPFISAIFSLKDIRVCLTVSYICGF